MPSLGQATSVVQRASSLLSAGIASDLRDGATRVATLLGTCDVTVTFASGRFTCPSCGAEMQYEHNRVRQYLRVLVLPLVPVHRATEYVECQGCKGTWDSGVLRYNPAEAQALFRDLYHEAAFRVMVRITAADARIDPAEVETVRDIYRSLTGRALDPVDITTEVAALMGDTSSVATDVASIALKLSNRSRETVVRAALCVARADGEITRDEWSVIGELGMTLGMSPAHVRGVWHETLASVEHDENV